MSLGIGSSSRDSHLAEIRPLVGAGNRRSWREEDEKPVHAVRITAEGST
jgi:hypothetical protein